MKALRIAILVASTAVAACDSPEADRTRGGGLGGDTGNRPQTVKMHEGSDPFWNTPDRIERSHPPLEPARQARQISQP